MPEPEALREGSVKWIFSHNEICMMKKNKQGGQTTIGLNGMERFQFASLYLLWSQLFLLWKSVPKNFHVI